MKPPLYAERARFRALLPWLPAWGGGNPFELGASFGLLSPELMQRRDYARIAFVAVLLIVVYYVFRILKPFLTALVWAAILATVFYPVFGWLARRLRRPRLASALACALLTVLIIMPVSLLLIALASESVEAYRFLQVKLEGEDIGRLSFIRQTTVYQWLLGRLTALGLPEPNLQGLAVRAVQAVSQFLVGHSTDVFSGFASFVFSFLIMLLTTYYMFLGGPEILREVRRLSPLRHEHEETIIGKFRDIAIATLYGNLLTALLQGAAGGLVFLAFGIPAPLLWGSVMALMSLVPVVGSALVWGPVVAYYVLTGAVAKGLGLLVLCAVVVGSIDNVVKPLIIRRRVQIPTFWVFIGVLGGMGAFGFLGLVLGPLMVAVLFAMVEIYKVEFRDELSEKLAS